VKSKLLVIDLWGLGDLAIDTPFLQAAGEKYSVTLLAKPHALELQPRFWPGVKVIPFVAPWTAFHGKYRLHRWPWGEIFRLRRALRAERFEIGVSARHDPRDHFLLWLGGAGRRLGFPRTGSRMFLTDPLVLPARPAHRYDNWRVAGQALGVNLPPRESLSFPRREGSAIVVHSGAGREIRVWPLDRYLKLVQRLRQGSLQVRVACDPDQRDWWRAAGETDVAAPQTVPGLMALLDDAALFIGNDSGAGHLAAINGTPTFTIFGPQLPEWFAPLHPQSAWLEGKPCPYKPCSDYCRFPSPHCLEGVTEAEVWAGVTHLLEDISLAGRKKTLPTGEG
jgi:ADP-heptose:LPS heptosyltransferase